MLFYLFNFQPQPTVTVRCGYDFPAGKPTILMVGWKQEFLGCINEETIKKYIEDQKFN